MLKRGLVFIALAAVIAAAAFVMTRPDDAATLTFHGRVGEIFQDNCVTCHQEGGIAPFSLDSYDEASQRAPMIEFMVSQRKMPPWFADPAYGRWANDRRLSEAERADILAWVRSGAPAGEPEGAAEESASVESSADADGWLLDEAPDTVIALPEVQHVPAEGIVPYRYVYVKTDFPEDRWIQKAELRPTGMDVAHHAIVFQEGPEDENRGPWIVAWAPGVPPSRFPEGTGKLLPAGGWLMFQLHYTTMGEPGTDRTELALVWADETPERRVRTRSVGTTEFEIPAGAENHQVVAELEFDEAGRILSFLPHMHYRGKAFRIELVHPDGSEEILLDVPNYDFNWQLSYVAEEPIHIEPGMTLRGRAWYDNSANNPANPDPAVAVEWGEQSFEEMMYGFFDWVPAAADREEEPATP